MAFSKTTSGPLEKNECYKYGDFSFNDSIVYDSLRFEVRGYHLHHAPD